MRIILCFNGIYNQRPINIYTSHNEKTKEKEHKKPKIEFSYIFK